MADASIDRLSEAATKQEHEFVIDFGTDRVIRWIGVYLLLGLGVLVKIAENIGSSISCYPATTSLSLDDKFFEFATTYCWETSQDYSTLTCGLSNFTTPIELLENPRMIKEFVQWFPYLLIVQAVVFALPWAYWHFRLGSRLTGHLKFIELLLSTIFEQLKEIDTVYYAELPYDKSSQNFDEDQIYKTEFDVPTEPSSQTEQQKNKKNTALQSVEISNPSSSPSSSLIPDKSKAGTMKKKDDGKRFFCFGKKKENDENTSLFDSFLVGDMTDRHFFSMLCFENFASMHILPYIISVFELTKSPLSKPSDPKAAEYYLNQGMLYLWCNDNNFKNILLVKRYFYKHVVTALIAFITLALLATFGVATYADAFSSETFVCQVQDDICFLCSIQKKRDLFAVFLCNMLLVAVIFVLSLRRWLTVRSASKKIMCHYFDLLKEKSNIALDLANDPAKKNN